MLPSRRERSGLAWLVALVLGCAAVPSDPGLPYRQEAEAAAAEGATERAVAAYQLAVTAEPNDPRSLRGLLEAQVANGDGEEALETLAWLEQLEAEPANPCAALALATDGRVARGAYDEAETTARRSVESGCEAATGRLSRVLAEQAAAAEGAGDRVGAFRLYEDAIDLDPGQARLFVAAGALLIAEGRVAESIRLLSSGLERHPDDRTLRDLMVRALSIR